MALSVVDLYKSILPKTNCKECGFPTCLSFASMVVSEQHPLKNCPHLSDEVVARSMIELEQQYAEGKWLKRDLAGEALKWAKTRAASMKTEDLPARIGGELFHTGQGAALRLPYFNTYLNIIDTTVSKPDGAELTRYEQVFILNHLAQGGSATPTGKWKGFIEFPNTVSKMVSMVSQVEEPLIERFTGRIDELRENAIRLGGQPLGGDRNSADLAMMFAALPRVPVALMFWDSHPEEDFLAKAKLMFDETITGHLDLESIVFLGERLRIMLCEGKNP